MLLNYPPQYNTLEIVYNKCNALELSSPPPVLEKFLPMKLVPGATKVGDINNLIFNPVYFKLDHAV